MRPLAAVFALSVIGCGDSGESTEDGHAAGALYAIMYEVYGDDDESTSYLNLIDSLDIDTVDPDDGRELGGGRAFLETYDGAVYVGEPSTPNVTRFTLNDAGKLEEAGKVSFANFGLQAGSIGSWGTSFISPEKAYHYDSEQLAWIVWNPTTMEVTGEVELPRAIEREGYASDASPAVLRDGRLFRTFYWVNWDTAEYSSDQLLGIFDTETDELLELVPETRCRASGNLVHQDEAGNAYFSNWIWPISGTLLKGAPQNCVLRLPAEGERFDDWTLTYANLFEGHEGAMFTYVGDGTALVAIFDETEVAYDELTDPWELASNPAWHVWTVDLETHETREVTGIPANTGAFTPIAVDGRLLLLVPGENWETTTAYEIVDGEAELAFVIPGWSYQFRKLR